MKLPLEITFRNVARTDDIEERIRSKAAKLDRFYDRITGCRVVIEAPHNHHHKGNAYQVHIELSVPGAELVVNQDKGKPEHTDLGVALRDAFNAMQRQLQAFADKNNPATSHSHMRISEVVGR